MTLRARGAAREARYAAIIRREFAIRGNRSHAPAENGLPVETYRGATVKMELRDKVRLEVGVSDSFVERAVTAVLRSARTGEVGDGKVFVLNADSVYRIRTGEADELAVTPEPRHGEVHRTA